VILEGKPVAEKVLAGVRAGVDALRARTGVAPTLAVVLVGDFAPSKVYVANKKRAADSVGIASKDFLHPEGLGQKDLVGLLRSLNEDPGIHGILLQLRCPPGSTRTRRSTPSLPRRTPTACIRRTSATSWRARRPCCRVRLRAAWRSSTTTAPS
jgi:5,10-methylene-tetrahydrofolate dehydrogenase/methenyl tetrahydrofolate cyclohydrolase